MPRCLTKFRPYYVVITVSSSKTKNLYDKIVQRYQTDLRTLETCCWNSRSYVISMLPMNLTLLRRFRQ